MLDGLFIAWAAAKQSQTAQAALQSSRMATGVSEARRQGNQLAADVDKLFMITQALWELLKAEHGYTDELLMQKVLEIDLSDGRLDGKVAKKARPDCPSCGKKMGRHPVCMYCGTQSIQDTFDR